MIRNKKYKIGLALSGGGIKGLCHAGVLKALEESGMKPDVISGVSAGAIIGALYADGFSPDEIAKMFEKITFRQMTKLQFPNGGFLNINYFQKFLEERLRAKTFEELSIPLRIVATDLDNGKSAVFSSGNLLDPIIASSSFPILFTPKQINGVNYIDGGVLKNFPVSVLKKDCEKVIGVNASPILAKEYKLTLKSMLVRVFHFMDNANSLLDKELCDILIEPKDIATYDTFDVDKCLEIYSLGYFAAKELLSELN